MSAQHTDERSEWMHHQRCAHDDQQVGLLQVNHAPEESSGEGLPVADKVDAHLVDAHLTGPGKPQQMHMKTRRTGRRYLPEEYDARLDQAPTYAAGADLVCENSLSDIFCRVLRGAIETVCACTTYSASQIQISIEHQSCLCRCLCITALKELTVEIAVCCYDRPWWQASLLFQTVNVLCEHSQQQSLGVEQAHKIVCRRRPAADAMGTCAIRAKGCPP